VARRIAGRATSRRSERHAARATRDTDRLAFARLHSRDANKKGHARIDEDAGSAPEDPPQLRRSSDEIVSGLTKASGADNRGQDAWVPKQPFACV
jgi:hypothetical protein